MTSLTNPRIEELIADLDPYRDYGDLGYEGVCEGARAGWINLIPAPEGRVNQQPFITNALTGLRLKGSSGSRQMAIWQKPLEANRARFFDRAVDDFDKMYSALVAASFEDRDPRAMKIWWEQFLGQPTKSLEGGASKEVVEIMRALAEKSANQVRPIDDEGHYIDVDSS